MLRRTLCSAAVVGASLSLTGAVAPSGASAAAVPPDAIRVGGPSSPADAKLAFVGSRVSKVGRAFRVTDARGRVVLTGRLTAATGTAAPWKRGAIADLSSLRTPGRYVVRVGALSGRPWTVRSRASSEGVTTILRYFDANRDGDEPSATHRPAHRNDAAAIVAGGPHDGERIDVAGGWMDAGDMLKFTHTTAYAAAMLQYAARLDATDAARLHAAADTGIRWLVRAHPSAGLFIAQVGDARDHDLGFRDPVGDDASGLPGIETRLAYPGMGGDLGGKAALALALAADRATGAPREQLLQQAREWYAAGVAAGGVMPSLGGRSGDFYLGDTAEDALAAGAVALWRVTGERTYLDDALRNLAAIVPDGRLSWNSVAGLAAADLCGALGRPTVTADPLASDVACKALRAQAAAAVARAKGGAFGTPGAFTWGQTGENGGAGALAALAGRVGVHPGALKLGATARDWLLGRNPWGASFVAGLGPNAPRHLHHWASVAGDGLPVGAVVGGPAPLKDIAEQPVGPLVPSQFNTPAATYEDRTDDYVTSEPAIDYAAGSILLLAAVDTAPAR
ncbi:Xyloglucan-specific endo-beta-1,4-glucanase BoGH9A [Paraconexibacter sp. AEG42_29]|uniref:Xyloglucan-specific endo-beta-1,4-glucanase BoGH9A n=1 Tax=Paraconexibacter sp. AEG42_29 TaxID=2997339 RepID=A0AAU7AZ54_9ACTN